MSKDVRSKLALLGFYVNSIFVDDVDTCFHKGIFTKLRKISVSTQGSIQYFREMGVVVLME